MTGLPTPIPPAIPQYSNPFTDLLSVVTDITQIICDNITTHYRVMEIYSNSAVILENLKHSYELDKKVEEIRMKKMLIEINQYHDDLMYILNDESVSKQIKTQLFEEYSRFTIAVIEVNKLVKEGI